MHRPRIGKLATLLACLTLTPATTNAAELIPGRCHMDTCNWFSIEEKDLAGTAKAEALFKVVLKRWQSHHPDGNYGRKTPRQGGQASISYAFCSKTKPGLIDRDGQGRWTAEYLPINAAFGPPVRWRRRRRSTSPPAMRSAPKSRERHRPRPPLRLPGAGGGRTSGQADHKARGHPEAMSTTRLPEEHPMHLANGRGLKCPEHEAATMPSVGIFWGVPDGEHTVLVTDRTPLAEAEPYGDCLTHSRGHHEVWEAWRRLGATTLRRRGLPQPSLATNTRRSRAGGWSTCTGRHCSPSTPTGACNDRRRSPTSSGCSA